MAPFLCRLLVAGTWRSPFLTPCQGFVQIRVNGICVFSLDQRAFFFSLPDAIFFIFADGYCSFSDEQAKFHAAIHSASLSQ